jgi:hypothetical protein
MLTPFDVPSIAEAFGQDGEVDHATPSRGATSEFRQALGQLVEPSVVAALACLHTSQDHQAVVDPGRHLVHLGEGDHAFCALPGGVVVASLIFEERDDAKRGLTVPPSLCQRANRVIEQPMLDQRGQFLRAALGFAGCSSAQVEVRQIGPEKFSTMRTLPHR